MFYFRLRTKKKSQHFFFVLVARPLWFVPNLKNSIFYFNDFTILNYVVGWQSRSFLTGLLQLWPKIKVFYSKKFGHFLSKSVSGYFKITKKLKKKGSDGNLARGGGAKKITFFAASLSFFKINQICRSIPEYFFLSSNFFSSYWNIFFGTQVSPK